MDSIRKLTPVVRCQQEKLNMYYVIVSRLHIVSLSNAIQFKTVVFFRFCVFIPVPVSA